MLNNSLVQKIILVVLAYLLYKQFFNNVEKMSNVEDIKKRISQIYNSDIETIRKLSKLSQTFQSTNGFVFNGDLTVRGKFNYLPKGTILAFNSIKAPEGWAVCDGRNGTPDLRGRFIYGFGSGKQFGSKGGSESHQLSVNELPAHSHGMDFAGNHSHSGTVFHAGGGGMGFSRGSIYNGKGNSISQAGNHRHNINNTGGNRPHNNMPPYYVLTWIMKL